MAENTHMRIVILSRNGQLYSTRSILNAARRRNHFVRVVDHMLCDLVIDNDENKVIYEGTAISGYDAVIPRIGFTVTPYGAAVVRQFESMGVFTTLRAEALIRSRDKLSCLQLLSSKGIPVPKSLISNDQYHMLQMANQLGEFPIVMKLLSGTHGLGVVKANDYNDLETISDAFYALRQQVLIQEFISESAGQDVRALVVDGKVVAAMLRQAQPGEFRSNLHRGGSSQEIKLSKEEHDIALKAANILGLKVAGVDMLRSDRGPLIIEVNASPGLEGIETTTGVDISKRIIEFVERKSARIKNGKRRNNH